MPRVVGQVSEKKKRTAREEIERAFWVSFKLPEQADALLDAYRDEVRKEAFEEAAEIVRTTKVPQELGKQWHIFVFALNRAAFLLDHKGEEPW